MKRCESSRGERLVTRVTEARDQSGQGPAVRRTSDPSVARGTTGPRSQFGEASAPEQTLIPISPWCLFACEMRQQPEPSSSSHSPKNSSRKHTSGTKRSARAQTPGTRRRVKDGYEKPYITQRSLQKASPTGHPPLPGGKRAGRSSSARGIGRFLRRAIRAYSSRLLPATQPQLSLPAVAPFHEHELSTPLPERLRSASPCARSFAGFLLPVGRNTNSFLSLLQTLLEGRSALTAAAAPGAWFLRLVIAV
ncbi:uncharacterized protein ACOB8E_018677 [Sarcophilus harrisii]